MSLPGRAADQAGGAGSRLAQTVDLAIIDSPAEFLALQQEWDGLFARSGRPQQLFQSHVVLRHWVRHYLEEGDRLSIICARLDGRLAMVWPLVRQRRLGFSVLRFMGGPVTQFSDVLAEDLPGLVEAGWRGLAETGADVLEIRKLRDDARLAEVAVPAESVVTSREEALFADCARRVAAGEPGPAYSARDRSNHRRRLRRLAEHGEVAFSTCLPGEAAAILARRAVALKRLGLAGRGIFSAALGDPRFEAFFADLAGDPSETSPLRLAVIEVGGVAAGIDLSLDCKGMTFGHVNAADQDYGGFGLGRLLIQHSFASAYARGSSRFDMLAPADAYKRAHADGATGVSDLTVPLSPVGRLLCKSGFPHLRPLAKQAAKSAPGWAILQFAARSWPKR
jgi:CelD/BcsL family acetyltransferase involved in cellulose biosynthesis